MSLPRRSFLRDALKSSVSIALLLASARIGLGQKSTRGEIKLPTDSRIQIPLDAQRDPVFLFTASTFEPYLNGIFQAPNARGEMIELRLVKIQKYEGSNRLTNQTRKSEMFSLMFKASGELPPFTSIHQISHSALGEFDLFLTPRKSETDELFYEAVINHVR